MSENQEIVYPEQGQQKKKSSGCGCFAIGCFILILLVVLPIVGGGIYVASIDDEEWGGFVVDFLKNTEISGTIKVEVQKSTDMSEEQKTVVIGLYENFLKNYDKLPEEKQKAIKKNIYVVIKKLFTDPKQFEQKPPAEFMEILTILGASSSFTTTTTTTETYDYTPEPTTQEDPTPTNETYDF